MIRDDRRVTVAGETGYKRFGPDSQTVRLINYIYIHCIAIALSNKNPTFCVDILFSRFCEIVTDLIWGDLEF